MSDAIPLPPRPRLEHYKKGAKELLAACRSSDPEPLRAWTARWVESWAESFPPAIGTIDRVVSDLRATKIARLADAQYFVARVHGFAGWPKFVKHIEALGDADSADARFEAAADAIVSGDIGTLRRLADADLVRQRSSRSHGATLLHYVAANGVEDYRQKTPANIVEIAALLLDAGADVNATCDAYGDRLTILDLAATSVHPERVGVQIPLMTLLLERGAIIERTPGAAVKACLANGRRQAAEFLSRRLM